MKLGEAKSRISELYRNAYSDSLITSYIDRLDRTIYEELFCTHCDNEIESFDGYDDDTDGDTELLASRPYDDIYFKFIQMNVDILNADTTRQQNSAALFSNAYQEYANWYNRKHMPIQNVGEFRV